MTLQYGKADYWNERYTRDQQSFEWFQRYSALKKPIIQNIKKSSNILQVGVGTSRLQEDMYDDGYRNITSIDISPVAIDLVKKRAEDKQELKFEVGDVLELSRYGEGIYDAVIDKGTMDSILCGEDAYPNIMKMLAGISKVLKANGVFFEVSYGIQENRMAYLQQPEYNWTVTVSPVTEAPPKKSQQKAKQIHAVPTAQNEEEIHYIYICKKK
ncbi:MAG: putative kinase domain protein [Streblomastix strix]|uniref:Putative kinase domain protein n=1 Tax=Streblomastix strix TaxID=222440 RepID=A0A5J4XBX0_9EUKA|nr:MAG: putative kinase domain protein [Streblomastix strix]